MKEQDRLTTRFQINEKQNLMYIQPEVRMKDHVNNYTCTDIEVFAVYTLP